MRRPELHQRTRGDLEISMTPMIDVVFLLLVFFVWTASFQVVENMLPSHLLAVSGNQPLDSTEPSPEVDFDEIIIRLIWEGDTLRWQINNVRVADLQAVRTRLDQIAAIRQAATVILHPDQEVPVGDVIDVYDQARLAGFEQVQFAASERI
ncbi:MAG: biopolymer transporter ExbD [Planctomycetaceae bacterium]|nr:biopolymer transporter ExbD [Planctomycetaceae bacterium]